MVISSCSTDPLIKCFYIDYNSLIALASIFYEHLDNLIKKKQTRSLSYYVQQNLFEPVAIITAKKKHRCSQRHRYVLQNHTKHDREKGWEREEENWDRINVLFAVEWRKLDEWIDGCREGGERAAVYHSKRQQ